MKKITFLLALFITSIGFSQDLLLGFETTESGGLNGGPFGNGNALQVNVVTDAGTNGSQVVKFIANPSGEIWQGININLSDDVDLTTTQTMTIDVKSATPITFLVKVNGGVSGAADAAAAVTHNGNDTWQTLSFTFNTSLDGKAAMANGIYSSFVIHAYWAPGATLFSEVTADSRTFYVDNIKGTVSTAETCSDGIMNNAETGVDCGGPNCSACPSPPMTAAPTPPARAAADVISIYSDAYTAIPGIVLDQAWCGANAITATTAGGNAVLAYNDKACQGIDFDANRQDFTGITYMHVDLFIQASTDLVGKVFNVKIVPDSGAESAFNIDINGLSPAPVPGTWYSYDMPITISGPHSNIRQFGITSNLNSVLWYDNLYFHKNTTLSTDNFDSNTFSLYPNPTQDSWTVKTNNIQMLNITVFDVLGKNVLSLSPNASEATINGLNLKSGLYFAQIKTANGLSSIKLIKK